MRLVTCLLLFVLPAVGGCGGMAFKGERPAVDLTGSDWPFRPDRMRVHPFTAFVGGENGRAVRLDVRMEMLDPVGDVSKAVGHYRMELYAVAATEGGSTGPQRLHLWEAAIDTLQANQKHWDPITRTYLFPLNLPQPLPTGKRLLLRVQFDSSAGARLAAELLLENPDSK